MSTNHFISLHEAAELTAHFRKMKDSILADGYNSADMLPTCETFEREAFDKLLARDGCTGIRIYLGMDNSNQLKLVIVGVNENKQDMVSTSDLLETEEVIENGVRCPVECPEESPLNS